MEEKWEIMVFVQSQSQIDSAPLKCRNSKEKTFLHPYVICSYWIIWSMHSIRSQAHHRRSVCHVSQVRVRAPANAAAGDVTWQEGNRGGIASG